eukprot:scaffold650_cov407-Prasinococcus_capsulatus_cf.AAC.9
MMYPLSSFAAVNCSLSATKTHSPPYTCCPKLISPATSPRCKSNFSQSDQYRILRMRQGV